MIFLQMCLKTSLPPEPLIKSCIQESLQLQGDQAAPPQELFSGSGPEDSKEKRIKFSSIRKCSSQQHREQPANKQRVSSSKVTPGLSTLSQFLICKTDKPPHSMPTTGAYFPSNSSQPFFILTEARLSGSIPSTAPCCSNSSCFSHPPICYLPSIELVDECCACSTQRLYHVFFKKVAKLYPNKTGQKWKSCSI